MKSIKIIICFFWICVLSWKAVAQNYHVELPYENVRNNIIVRATVDGIEGRYIFDTGAPMCLTYSRMKKSPDVDFTEQKVKDAHGQESVLKQIVLKSVSLGEINFQNIPAVILDEGNPMECFGVDGVIGSSLFPYTVVRLDARKQVLILASQAGQFTLNLRTMLPMEINRQNIPFIYLNLGNGNQDKVMFDTGASSFYEMSGASYTALQVQDAVNTLSTGYGVLGMGVGGIERPGWKYRVKINDMRLGIGKFKNVITETMDGPVSLLGVGILKYGIVTLDFPGHKFYFEPYEPRAVDMDRKVWNVAVTVSGDSLVAGFVWESMKKEIKGGEKVVAVNGKRFDKIDPCKAMTSSIVKMEGEEALITIIDRSGKERELTIRKE